MNLRGIVNGVTQGINPNEEVTIQFSNGFTIGAGRKQVPAYDNPIPAIVQIQALDGDELEQLAGLNIQGVLKAMYLFGPLAGVVRPEQTGGDLVTRADGTLWLTMKVLETWPQWTKVAIVRQGDGS